MDELEKVLKQHGIKPAETVRPERIVMSVEGDEATGKTHFSLTAPRPLVMLNIDRNLEGVIDKFDLDGIYVERFVLPYNPLDPDPEKESTLKKYKVEWQRFTSAYVAVLKRAKTVVIDTGTDFWLLARLALLGKASQVKPQHYGPVNAQFSALVNTAINQPTCNLIITHKMQDEYKGEKTTGRRVPDAFKHMRNLVQVALTLNKRMVKDPASGIETPELSGTLTKCGFDLSLEGTTFLQSQLTFADVAMFVTGEPEGWD
jgi:hypothetical protein